ncbi:TonB-dependent receptor [Mucilaginibacter paludis]|uniref:TonB-dependent siderophore receptor n=1 Tax=Mucilaginibacter paludis DSM 18603 TaxID=714943 RepID=H1Y068_9SPHI|nr:TonB-dependent receptor [Mucilaginibacter paludis]EHQ27977.1 TonB-dependent siderophore receptor [Mucilaginibacter paludis DSM 18603]
MKQYNYLKTLSAFLLLLVCSLTALGQQVRGTIRGRIVTNKNEPAENVSVVLKGTNYGTVTNDDGKFQFRVPAGSYTLVVSHVNLRNQELPVSVITGRLTQVPVIVVSANVSSLREISVNGEKTNKFVRKRSDDVAKMPLDNLENPQVYSSVGKELLQEQAVFSADDAIRNVPGITRLWAPTGRAGDGGSYFTLRGFSVQTSLRNGISGLVTNTVDAANLEKLEVVKGPSGTLYGSSLISFGGLINRVTKKPFENTAGEITYAGGSYNFNRISVDYNTPIDSAKKALLRINSAYNSTGSFQDNGFNKNFVFDPSFSYKVSDRLTLSFDAEISHGTGTTPPIFYFASTIADLGVSSADQLNINYKRAYQANDLVTTSDNVNFYGKVDYKISDSWQSQTSFSTTNSSSSGYEPYFYLLAGNNSIARDVWAIDGNVNTLQIQQNFAGDFKIAGLRNRLLIGLDFLKQTANLKYSDPNSGSDAFDVINLKGPIPTYNNFNKAKVDSLFQNLPLSTTYSRYNNYTYSAYVSDVLNITDNLSAMASLRIDYFDSKAIDNPATGSSSNSYHQVALSPKFGLVYQLVKNHVSLFGNYMNGFSNTTPGTDFYGKSFKPEQANQLEGGIKLDVFNGKLSSTISYYDIKVKDIIKADPSHANFSIQDGSQYSRGFEAEVIANPVKGLNIVAGYSHNNSLMTNSSPTYDNGRRPQTAGPANSANFWASYTLIAGNAKGLGLGFGGNYSGDNQVINNAYNGVFTLPSFTVLNTGVFYNKEKYRLAVNVNNLTNKEYWIGYTTVNPQMLRQVIASLSYKF